MWFVSKVAECTFGALCNIVTTVLFSQTVATYEAELNAAFPGYEFSGVEFLQVGWSF